jgi:hypothetical protein
MRLVRPTKMCGMKGGKEKPMIANPDRIFSTLQGTTTADGCNSILFIFQLADCGINCSVEREAG